MSNKVIISAKELIDRGLTVDTIRRYLEQSRYTLPKDENLLPEDVQFHVTCYGIGSRPMNGLRELLDARHINVPEHVIEAGNEVICHTLIERIRSAVLYFWPELRTYKEELKDLIRGSTPCDWQLDGFAVRADAHTSFILYRSACINRTKFELGDMDEFDDLDHFRVLDETYTDPVIEKLNKEIDICRAAFKEVMGIEPILRQHRQEVSAGYIYYVFIGDDSGFGYQIQYKSCHYIDRCFDLDASIVSLIRDFG